MFCYKCGLEIPDNAHFCPFCGEVLGEPRPTTKETPIDQPSPMEPEQEQLKETPVDQSSVMESELKLSLGGFDDHIQTSQYLRKEINLFIENTGSYPKYSIEVQISGPQHVYIPPAPKRIRVISSHTTKRVTFTITPRDAGSFMLKATLRSESGHSLELPIRLEVEASSSHYQESYRTPRSAPEASTAGTFIAIAIGLGIIALVLIGFGIPMTFNSLFSGSGSLPIGITMIVIGIIIFAIATQGKCCYCFLGCDGCDCDGCDCDC
ncbi:MAG: zinc-ribbon domain-containing protein [Promethearchaeota archaeon]